MTAISEDIKRRKTNYVIQGIFGESFLAARSFIGEFSGPLIGGGYQTAELQFDPISRSARVSVEIFDSPLNRGADQ